MSALRAPNIPAEIVSTILNLAEFMEHYDKPLPIDIRTLGNHAENCHAYAKALHYKELEFLSEEILESSVKRYTFMISGMSNKRMLYCKCKFFCYLKY